MLEITAAFIGFIEIRQLGDALKYIAFKSDRIRDSNITFFANTASRRDEEDLLHLITLTVSDPDVITTANELEVGTLRITFGESLATAPEIRIRRRVASLETGDEIGALDHDFVGSLVRLK